MVRRAIAEQRDSPEESQKRREWILRLKNLPPPEPVDEGTMTRFLAALDAHRAEEANRRQKGDAWEG